MKTPFILAAILLTANQLTFAADSIPPSEAGAKDALNKSPRHGEWVDVKMGDSKTPIRCYVVYPEVKEKAPVVIVIQEIFGLSDWIRAVADQLAADGFIAIAPDFLSGKGKDGGGTDSFASADDVRAAVRELKLEEVIPVLNAVREYGIKLPAANGKSACVGFCWGGAMSFNYAIAQPDLNAAVVYYGSNPADADALAKIKAPVLGCYGSDDARVNATIEPCAEQMKKLGKSYTYKLYEGAGHGFVRQQDGRDGANLKAAQEAWRTTVKFLKDNTK